MLLDMHMIMMLLPCVTRSVSLVVAEPASKKMCVTDCSSAGSLDEQG